MISCTDTLTNPYQRDVRTPLPFIFGKKKERTYKDSDGRTSEHTRYTAERQKSRKSKSQEVTRAKQKMKCLRTRRPGAKVEKDAPYRRHGSDVPSEVSQTLPCSNIGTVVEVQGERAVSE